MTRKPYPTDVSDEEWAFVAPYLTLMSEEAPQREQSLREVFNGLRWMVRAGSGWRLMPHDLPPWAAVYQQGPKVAKLQRVAMHRLRALPSKGSTKKLRIPLFWSPEFSANLMQQ